MTVEHGPKVTGSARNSLVGTMTRSDGSTELTYNGHPLHYYSFDDHDPNATKGEGLAKIGHDRREVGEDWYPVAPKGQEVLPGPRRGSTATSAPRGS